MPLIAGTLALLFSCLVCSPPDVHQLLPVGFYIFAGISSHLGKVVVQAYLIFVTDTTDMSV